VPSDRSVSVVADTAGKTGKTVVVTETGPAYQGWRPPAELGGQEVIQYDADNPFAPSNPSIYGSDIDETVGTLHTSTMVVEVQIQNEVLNKLGIEGDLAWQTITTGPVRLSPTFSGEVFVTLVASARPRAVVARWCSRPGDIVHQDPIADQ
jgi:hypothetical protein